MQPSSMPEPIPDLAVSVVLYHSPLDQFLVLLNSINSAAIEAELSDVEVVCVDHSSDTEYASRCQVLIESCKTVYSLRIKLLESGPNRGYGAGHNRAMAEVASHFHLILNPDVELAPDSLKLALRTMQSQQNITLLAPIGLHPSGAPAFLAKAYPSVWVLGFRAFAPQWLKAISGGALARYEMRDTHNDITLRPITLASGCCMWVRRAIFDSVGGFDESYFLYFEDYDLSLKLAAQGVVMEHRDIRIVHHGGDASRKGLRHINWFIGGAARFFNRWGWRWLG